MRRPQPLPAGPGQESVWDYPRPPQLEPTPRRLRVLLGDTTIADTTKGYRVLETSHPPSYYLPPTDCDLTLFTRAVGSSFCEWKGHAIYWTVTAPAPAGSGSLVAERMAWSYPTPTPGFIELADHVAFYPSAFDCFVDDERVVAQPGGFYGGWVTESVVGPFKGVPGSNWW